MARVNSSWIALRKRSITLLRRGPVTIVRNLLVIECILLFAPVKICSSAEPSKVVYIQAVRVDLKEAPKSNSQVAGSVNRGDTATVVETQGTWLKVKCGKKTGWISRLFVTDHRPVGNADLMKDVKENLVTTSRRRPSSYAVSATARGLMTSDRGREGREMYETDGEALESVEKYQLPKDAVKKFSASGKLTLE